MAIVFNADEVFRLAEQIERNGGIFYRKAAEKLPKASKLLMDLAAQEDEHLAVFTALHKAVSGRESEATSFDPDSEAALYLKAMAGGYVFDTKKDPVEAVKAAKTLADILALAIGAEKDSIAFYVGLKAMVPRKLGTDKVEQIIQEEMKHLRLLSEKMAAAKG